MAGGVSIRGYRASDEEAVVLLWQACELTRPWNNPQRDIQRKLVSDAGPFLVAEADDNVVGTAMVGYDGHRGWINYLAVHPTHRGQGIGRALMEHAERSLSAQGCPKLNLQVRQGNTAAVAFYERLGYLQDEVVSLGKRLIDDNNTPPETA